MRYRIDLNELLKPLTQVYQIGVNFKSPCIATTTVIITTWLKEFITSSPALILKKRWCWGAWAAQLVKHLTLDFSQVMITWLMRLSLTSGSALTVHGLLGILSLLRPLSLPDSCVHSLSLSK